MKHKKKKYDDMTATEKRNENVSNVFKAKYKADQQIAETTKRLESEYKKNKREKARRGL